MLPLNLKRKHRSAVRIARAHRDQYTTLDGLTPWGAEAATSMVEPKNTLSSIDISALILELASSITGKHVDNVYQLGDKTLLFKLRPDPSYLVIEVGRRVHATQYEMPVPRTPPQFCMALRKRLRNAKVTSIYQHEFERIVLVEFEHRGERYLLVIELFPRGNLILVDGQGEINLALWRAQMRDRTIRKGEVYTHAPSSGQNPLTAAPEDFRRLDTKNSNLSKALAVAFSVGGLFAREVIRRSGLEDADYGQIDEEVAAKVYQSIQEIKAKLSAASLAPETVLDSEGSFIDVTPFPFKMYEGFRKKTYTSFNQAVDEYFANFSDRRDEQTKQGKSSKERMRIQRMLEAQEKQAEDLRIAIEVNQRKGQLILSHILEMSALVRRIIVEKQNGEDWDDILIKSKSWEEISPRFGLSSINGREGYATLLVEDTEINVGLNKKPHDEARRYFDLAKDARQKLTGDMKAIERTKAVSDDVRLDDKKDVSHKLRSRRIKRWYDKFFHFESSEGLLVLIGRDSSSNEVLIKRYTSQSDMVFHAEIHGAPFVVVKANGNEIGEATIREAAQAAVSYSSAWRSGLSSADAYYIRPDQVTKEAPSGQYLTKGAFMISGNRNYVKGVEARLAVGIRDVDGSVEIVGGPLSAITNQTEWFVCIMPGDMQPMETAKRIVEELSRFPSLPPSLVEALDAQDFVRVLPRGGCVLTSCQKTQIRSK